MECNERLMATTMIPSAELLPPAHPDARIRADGRPTPEFREELRHIPNVRNALSVASVYAQTVLVLAAVVWIGHPLAWLAGIVLMGRANAQFASLMHEAAHRLLFSHRRLNDAVGRWLLGFPVWTSTDAYRRVHMAHHREEFGPDEPDIALYRGYPISPASFRRKLWRDLRGSTGWKLFRAQISGGLRSSDRRVRHTLYKVLFVQAVIATLMTVLGHPLMYPLLWLLPYFTVWRVINRLRSVAEHGGMKASKDRRETTHSVRQHLPARFVLVPFHIGWHLAHHVDSGIPFRNLPRFHEALVAAGYVTPGLEYPNYRALWKQLRSGS
jgi:fatty acid desaturase